MPVLSMLWIGFPFVIGLLVIPSFAAQRELVDQFVGGITGSEGEGWLGKFSGLWLPLLVFIGIAMLTRALVSFQNMVDVKFRDKASMFVQGEVHQRALEVSLERMDKADYYDRLTRAESAAGAEFAGVLQQVFVLFRLLFEVIGLLIVGMLAHPIVGLIMSVVFLVSLFIRLESDIVKRRLNRDLTRSGRQSDYLQQVMTRPETVRDMRISGSNEALVHKWSLEMQHSLGLRMNANRREIRRGVLVSSVQAIGLFGAILWLLLQLKSGLVTAGTVVIVFQAIRQAYMLSATMAFPLGKIYIQSGKLWDLVEYLHERPDQLKVSSSALTPGSRGQIELTNVSYKYSESAKPSLQDIQLVLNPGETVALVGENGAGKSTLVRLILGLYRPSEGQITWDGVDYELLDSELLRESMSATFQDFVRYETTVRDNVSMAGSGTGVTDKTITNALQQAGALELASLNGGLDAKVGLLTEGGQELSGGQWQRLAIARAALRDARLIVLDEPTSAIDPQHETDLYRSFRQLAEGRTVLFVSHRLGWARYADRIIVLQEGRIIEEGTHDELIALGNAYAAMFQAQAEWYRGNGPV
jgi:ATP-binding cassette subfamily B protein